MNVHAKGVDYDVAEIWQLDQVAILSGCSNPLPLSTGHSVTTLLLIRDTEEEYLLTHLWKH